MNRLRVESLKKRRAQRGAIIIEIIIPFKNPDLKGKIGYIIPYKKPKNQI